MVAPDWHQRRIPGRHRIAVRGGHGGRGRRRRGRHGGLPLRGHRREPARTGPAGHRTDRCQRQPMPPRNPHLRRGKPPCLPGRSTNAGFRANPQGRAATSTYPRHPARPRPHRHLPAWPGAATPPASRSRRRPIPTRPARIPQPPEPLPKSRRRDFEPRRRPRMSRLELLWRRCRPKKQRRRGSEPRRRYFEHPRRGCGPSRRWFSSRFHARNLDARVPNPGVDTLNTPAGVPDGFADTFWGGVGTAASAPVVEVPAPMPAVPASMLAVPTPLVEVPASVFEVPASLVRVPVPVMEATVPASEPSTPILEESTPAPEPSTATPGPRKPAPEASTPALQQSASTPEPSTPTHFRVTPTAEPSAPRPGHAGAACAGGASGGRDPAAGGRFRAAGARRWREPGGGAGAGLAVGGKRKRRRIRDRRACCPRAGSRFPRGCCRGWTSC